MMRRQAFLKIVEELARQHLGAIRAQSSRFEMIAEHVSTVSVERDALLIVDTCVDRIVDEEPTPMDFVRVSILAYFLSYLGTVREHAEIFCRRAFPQFAEQLRSPLRRGLVGVRELSETSQPRFITFIQDACKTHNLTYKGWVTHVIDMADQGVPEARDWLWCILQVVGLHTPRINTVSRTMLSIQLAAQRNTLQQFEATPYQADNPIWVVADHQFAVVRAFLIWLNEQRTAQRSQAQEWCHWLRHDLPAIRRLSQRHRDEIISDPARLVRKDGTDCVDVSQLSLVQDMGIRSFAFVPNGGAYPDMEIVFTVRRLGCIDCTLTGSLIDLTLHVPAALFETVPETEHDLRRLALEFMVIEGLHRFVVGASIPANGHRFCGKSTSRTLRGIRSHFPHLPAGAKASKDAIERCMKDHGCTPPVGRTYNEGWKPEGGEQIVEMRPRIVFNDTLFSTAV